MRNFRKAGFDLLNLINFKDVMTMLDTVVLILPFRQFRISNMFRFGTNEDDLRAGLPVRKWVSNPTKAEERTGRSYPRLTLYRRNRIFTLRVEFSVSKLLFSNSLDEVEEKDFTEVINILSERLLRMGASVASSSILENAPVSAFHASKNVVLSGGYTVAMAIREFAKVNLHMKLDLDHKNYRNEGETLQYYTKSHSFVIYDKIRDLGKYTRKIDPDLKAVQLSLFENIQKTTPQLEVIRLEARLTLKKKMDSVLKKLGYAGNPKFKDIFKKELCRKVVQLYWVEMIAGRNLFIFDMDKNPERMLETILKQNPRMTRRQAIYLFGLITYCREIGIRKLRSLLAAFQKDKDWGQLNRDLKFFCTPAFQNRQPSFINDIQQAIDRFEPYRQPIKYAEKLST